MRVEGIPGFEFPHSHGAPSGVDPAHWFGSDPELGLVHADMDAWNEAHPCGADDNEVCHAPVCHCSIPEDRRVNNEDGS